MVTHSRNKAKSLLDVIAKLPEHPIIQSTIDGLKFDLQSQVKEGDLRRSDISNKLEENRRLAVQLNLQLVDIVSSSEQINEALSVIIQKLHKTLLDKSSDGTAAAGNNIDFPLTALVVSYFV
jgi:hypothetical protein